MGCSWWEINQGWHYRVIWSDISVRKTDQAGSQSHRSLWLVLEFYQQVAQEMSWASLWLDCIDPSRSCVQNTLRKATSSFDQEATGRGWKDRIETLVYLMETKISLPFRVLSAVSPLPMWMYAGESLLPVDPTHTLSTRPATPLESSMALGIQMCGCFPSWLLVPCGTQSILEWSSLSWIPMAREGRSWYFWVQESFHDRISCCIAVAINNKAGMKSSFTPFLSPWSERS